VIEVDGFVRIDLLRLDATELSLATAVASAVRAWHPRVVVIQASPADVKNTPLGLSLDSEGYVVGGFDGVNTYLAHADDEHGLKLLYPACSLDDYVTTDFEALAAENLRLSTELELLDRTLRARIGADRAVLGAPSLRSRRFAMRHDLAEIPVISLDRVVVAATTETGGRELAELLAAALDVELLAVDHPADIAWDQLRERAVIAVACPFSEMSRILFLSNGFRVVSIARHPVDSLLAHKLVETQGAVRSRENALPHFLEWATGTEAGERLNLNARWLVEPGTIRVEYDKLSLDPYRSVVELCDEIGLSVHELATSADGLSRTSARIQTRLKELAVDRSVLSAADASRLGEAHELAFERLGLPVPEASGGSLPDEMPSSTGVL
jgi:hypothetical protein